MEFAQLLELLHRLVCQSPSRGRPVAMTGLSGRSRWGGRRLLLLLPFLGVRCFLAATTAPPTTAARRLRWRLSRPISLLLDSIAHWAHSTPGAGPGMHRSDLRQRHERTRVTPAPPPGCQPRWRHTAHVMTPEVPTRPRSAAGARTPPCRTRVLPDLRHTVVEEQRVIRVSSEIAPCPGSGHHADGTIFRPTSLSRRIRKLVASSRVELGHARPAVHKRSRPDIRVAGQSPAGSERSWRGPSGWPGSSHEVQPSVARRAVHRGGK